MKRQLFFLALFLGLQARFCLLYGQLAGLPTAPVSDAVGAKSLNLSPDEADMIREINLLRANPTAYIPLVQAYVAAVKADPGFDDAYKTEEENTARELIVQLQQTQALPLLKVHAGLYQVCRRQGDYLKKIGQITHRGEDGSLPWDRVQKATDLQMGNENLVGGGQSVREQVMLLLVDSGVKGRGHRKNLLDPSWQFVACYKIGDIADISENWIQVFGK